MSLAYVVFSHAGLVCNDDDGVGGGGGNRHHSYHAYL